MHEHTDETCEHDLKVCVACGNVYCTKCLKEWFKEQWTYHYQPYPNPYTVTYQPNTVTVYGDTTGTYHIHSE